MTIGDIVTIYAKPLTHEQAEGDAKLVKHLRTDSGIKDFSCWEVEFLSEPGITFQRWVYPS